MQYATSEIVFPSDREVSALNKLFTGQKEKDLLLTEYHRRIQANDNMLEFVHLMFAEIYGAQFVEGEHHRKLCGILNTFMEALENGASPNLMIFLPPRSGKTSLLCTFLAWLMGKHPNWDVIMSSYNEDRGADMGRMVKRHFDHALFKELFPECKLTKESTSAVRSELTKGGAMTAAGVGTATTGRGSRCFLIDDPFKDSTEADSALRREEVWRWYGSVVNTRLAPEGAGQIVALTRWHIDDLAGRCLATAKKDPEATQWMVYSFPALTGDPGKEVSFFPERFSVEWLQKKRAVLRNVDPRMWSALYQQNPVPEEGVIFKNEWFKDRMVAESAFPPMADTTNCVTVDFAVTAGGGDHTAIYTVSFDCNDKAWVRPGHFRGRVDPEDSLKALEAILRRDEPRYFFVEKGPIWRSLGSRIRNEVFRRARVYPQVIEISRGKKAKPEVAMPYTAAVQSGMVNYCDSPHTRDVLIPQHLAFGASDEDDDVDSIALPFVERGSILIPTAEVELPAEEPYSYEDSRDKWLRENAYGDEEKTEEDPFPLFAGDHRHG